MSAVACDGSAVKGSAERQLSVTSLTSADVDPSLLDSGCLPQAPSQPPPPPTSPPPNAFNSFNGEGATASSLRLSMRRNTVPLVGPPTSGASSAKQPTSAATMPAKASRGRQKICRYCLNLFDESANWKGACPDAPDRVKACLDRLTCLPLADGVSYHCCADSEGDYIPPCQLGASSNSGGRSHRHCRHHSEDDDDADYDGAGESGTYDAAGRSSLVDRLKAWSCVCLLALCVPCLCCYPACHLGHRACRRLRLVGGRHVALWTTPPATVRKDPTRNTIAGAVADERPATSDLGASTA